jgi:hypothetical protein
MSTRQITYQDGDGGTPRTVAITRLAADGPHVWKARSVPPTPGIQGWGQSDGAAIVDLFRAETRARGGAASPA